MITDYLPLNEYSRLFPYLSYDNYLCLRVSLETGLRIGDVVALRTAALCGNKITYIAQKTGKYGTAIISKELAEKLHRVAGNVYIFESNSSKNGHRTRQTVWKDVKKAAKIAGIDRNIAPHSARKTYAVQTFKNKGFAAAKRELQHDDPATTMLYVFSGVMSDTKETAEKAIRSDELEQLADYIAEKVYQRIKGEL
ncbi:MAG: tyrosine-type recombinase/integrase [Clostridia bacterium]|nr:tyrosine-type recombinase/integrase [Clostridia bacterium]